MNRQLALAMLAGLAGLWSAAALPQGKPTPPVINPPPVIKTDPFKPPVTPKQGVTLPEDPTGGHIGDRARLDADRNAALRRELEEQKSGRDATRKGGAGPAYDPLELCKKNLALRGSSLCGGNKPDGKAGKKPSVDAATGTIDYDTKSGSSKAGGGPGFDGPTAKGAVPSRGSEASDDKENELNASPGPNDKVTVRRSTDGRSATRTWTDSEGRRHREDSGYNNSDSTGHTFYRAVEVRDGSGAEGGRGRLLYESGEIFRDDGHVLGGFRHDYTWRTNSQPGERPSAQVKARPWFCARVPEVPACKPVTPGSQVDPANPDGEGTGMGRPQAETPRLGREAVINPGPVEREIRGGKGGSSGPLDMKDPGKPSPPK